MTQEEQKQTLATVASTIVALCGAGLNQKQAAFMAWRADRLSEQLRTGICHFSYQKKDGTLRHARGTLRTDLIPAEFQPHGNERSRNYTARAYFDLDRQAWRSFTVETLGERWIYEPVI